MDCLFSHEAAHFCLLNCRLSEQVALKLADNNPNIADLSDMNRPTNLAEKFSTLYDDEWTEAFDALSKYPEIEDETNAIRFLLKIVQVDQAFAVENFCRYFFSHDHEMGLVCEKSFTLTVTSTRYVHQINKYDIHVHVEDSVFII